MRDVPWYDNSGPRPVEGAPHLLAIERVYRLDLGRFQAADWAALESIYRALPGRYRAHRVAMWFGDVDGEAPSLGASAEPSGLEVSGVLPRGDWARWDRAFRRALAASDLPIQRAEEGG